MIAIWIRATVDWDDEAAFLAQCDPVFRGKVAVWDATFTLPFHRFRARVRDIAAGNLAAVAGARVEHDWDAIADGTIVLPVDDDDWFAPDVAARLEARGVERGCTWTATFLEVPLSRRHGIGTTVRRVVPGLGYVFRCTTNNYALVKRAGERELAARHVVASRVFDAERLPHLDARLSVMNRSLGSRTSVGHSRPTVGAAELRRRHARYRRLYRMRRTLPDWCEPYVEAMAALMEEVELR